MGQPPESDIAAQAVRGYFGLYPGVVRPEIKVPHVYSLEEPIDNYIPSSLEGVTDTEELLRQSVEASVKAVRRVVDVTSVFQPLQMIGETMVAINEAIGSELKSTLEHLRKIDFEEVTERARVAGRELGERGWLVGPLMTSQGLLRVLKGDTDQIMKERYPVNRLIGMVRELDDFRWQKAILEAMYSYRDGRHRVVVLSLFPVIEALVRERADHRVDTDGIDRISEVNQRVASETRVRAEEKAFLLAASEASIFGFIVLRWNSNQNMLEDAPSDLDRINRNWALHGADDPERWDPIDAHRLLQVAAVLAHEKKYRDAKDAR